MKKRNIMYLLASLTVVAISVGITISQLLFPVGAQPDKTPTIQNTSGIENKPVAWHRKKLPLNLSNSVLEIDTTSFSSDKDWILGGRVIGKEGEEKLYAGIVTWEESSEKMKGFLRVSKIDNFPIDSIDFKNENVKLHDILEKNQSLIVYMEKKEETQLFLKHNGLKRELDFSGGSFSIFDGNRSSTKIEGPSSLLNELHIRKLRKELLKSGSDVTVNGIKEEK